MNKSEFNNYSFLEIENEILRGKVKRLTRELEEAKWQVEKDNQEISRLNKVIKEYENNREKLQPK